MSKKLPIESILIICSVDLKMMIQKEKKKMKMIIITVMIAMMMWN